MKEEFILPKYWYLKIDDENRDLIIKWRKEVFNFDDDISNWYCVFEGGWCWEKGNERGAVLSTEQFKEHVLKLNKSKEIIKEDYTYLIKLLNEIK